MIATGLNLPTALDVCARLGTWWDRDACRGGVFMENLSTASGCRPAWLRGGGAVSPRHVASRTLPFVGDDWNRTAETCARIERDFVDECFQSFGRDVSTRSTRD